MSTRRSLRVYDKRKHGNAIIDTPIVSRTNDRQFTADILWLEIRASRTTHIDVRKYNVSHSLIPCDMNNALAYDSYNVKVARTNFESCPPQGFHFRYFNWTSASAVYIANVWYTLYKRGKKSYMMKIKYFEGSEKVLFNEKKYFNVSSNFPLFNYPIVSNCVLSYSSSRIKLVRIFLSFCERKSYLQME